MRFYVHLDVTKLHPSATGTSGYILEAKFSPELCAELTGGGSVYLGAQLGPEAWRYLQEAVLQDKNTTPRF